MTPRPSWPAGSPSASPRLQPGDVHVWSARLDNPPVSTQQLLGSLADAERQHGDRHLLASGRSRSAASRGLLRWLLGAYLRLSPGVVPITLGALGKPALGPGAAAPRLHFNVSHSDDLIVLAISADREVGVDVERVRSRPDATLVAARFFAPSEAVALQAMAPPRRDEAFHRCWTRKEAYLKARGAGLSLALNALEVGVEPGTGFGSIRPLAPDDSSAWLCCDLCPAPGFLGALVVAGEAPRVRCWEWRR